MANENVPAPAPIISDDQILPFAAWVPNGKRNYVLDLQKRQKNPIFQIAVDILQNTNSFRAFTASASLDENWFKLDANLLREALEITLIDQAHPFVSPPSGDAIMDFVNELGYPQVIHFVSSMAVNYLYQSWRAILSMINQCLTGKTFGHDRPRYPVLQMLWGIITSTNVDFAKLMWEEFVQATQTFLTNKANLGSPTKKGRKDKPHVIPFCRFTKLIMCHLGRIHNIHQRSSSPFHLAEEDLRLGNLKFIPKGEVDEVFGMPIPNELITNNIKNAPCYYAYLKMVAKHDQKVTAEKEGKKKSASTKQPKPKLAIKKSSKPAPAPKLKVTREKPSKAFTAKPPKPKPAKEKSRKATPLFALRNFDLEDMELESTNSGPNAKLPILKLGEYEMWAIRIKQYFQIQDYALWEVIENGDSWVSVSQTTKENGITVTKMSTPVTVEEKTKKKNDVKELGLLISPN
ncbi:hypothetical protein Tco_0508374 [Tanacetum coccineum]